MTIQFWNNLVDFNELARAIDKMLLITNIEQVERVVIEEDTLEERESNLLAHGVVRHSLQ